MPISAQPVSLLFVKKYTVVFVWNFFCIFTIGSIFIKEGLSFVVTFRENKIL